MAKGWHWECSDCGHVGTAQDANQDRDFCSHCNASFPSSARLCPGCGRDSLCSACPKCEGSWYEWPDEEDEAA